MKRKVMKPFSYILLGLLLAIGFTVSVGAKDIEIDGNFSDWDAVEKTRMTSVFYRYIAFVQKGNMLYMYAKENSTNSWEKYFSYTAPTLISRDGQEHALVIEETSSSGNKSELRVRKQSGYEVLSGSEGKRDKNGTYRYELAIPLDEFGDVTSVRLFTDYSSTQTIQVVSSGNEGSTTQETGTTENVTPEETPEEIVAPSSNGKITIDGNFSDWENYPHIFLTNWNMPENERNANNCRSLSIAVDDDNIYFHVKMIGGWNDPFNGNEYMLSVGDYGVSLNMVLPDHRTLPQYNLSPNQYELKIYYKNKSAHLDDETLIDGAKGKLVVYSNGPDEVEVMIPKEIFRIIHGIEVNDVKEITLTNPNLFDHGISSSATSTAPYLGVVICLASVGITLLILNRRRWMKHEKTEREK